VEKKFEQLEQDQQASQRKKKRTSGQSTQTTPTATTSSSFFSNTNSHSKPLHLDMSNVRDSYSPPYHLSPGPTTLVRRCSSPRKSSGSNTPIVRSPLGRPHYVDSGTQTEPDEYDAHSTPPVSSPGRRSFIPLTHRLLTRCHQDRLRFAGATQRWAEAGPIPVGKDTQAVKHPPDKPAPPVVNGLGDVEMKDANTVMTPKSRPSVATRRMESQFILPSTPGDAAKSLIQTPGPSPATQNAVVIGNFANGFRSDLRLQLPPSNFSSFAMAGAPESATPTSIQSPSPFDATSTHPSVQTPGSSIAAASPIKKKISLVDYFSRKGSLVPTSEKTQATAMLPPQKSPSRSQSITTASLSSDGQHQAVPDTEGAAQRGIFNTTDVIMKDTSKQPSAPPNIPFTSDELDYTPFQP
jgi:hypothetical protein